MPLIPVIFPQPRIKGKNALLNASITKMRSELIQLETINIPRDANLHITHSSSGKPHLSWQAKKLMILPQGATQSW